MSVCVVKWTMCDINCIWLFNLLVAVVLILLQQQQHVVGSTQEQQYQQRQQQLQHHKYISPYDGISSYAAAAAANYLRRSTLPHNVVKREIKNDKSTDFISYLNGKFNIDEEKKKINMYLRILRKYTYFTFTLYSLIAFFFYCFTLHLLHLMTIKSSFLKNYKIIYKMYKI